MIAFFIRLRQPLNDLLKLYAEATRRSKAGAIVSLLESHPALIAFYENLLRDRDG